jgi:ethanolamine utilization protein EutQ (cupin superfamily)
MEPKEQEKVSAEIEKSKVYVIAEIAEYIPNSIVIKEILRKSTGNISVKSFDCVEGLTEKITRFDTFIQLIEGEVEIVIDGRNHLVKTGGAIVIPAHSSNTIKANGKFKLIQTIIKSGYDQL